MPSLSSQMPHGPPPPIGHARTFPVCLLDQIRHLCRTLSWKLARTPPPRRNVATSCMTTSMDSLFQTCLGLFPPQLRQLGKTSKHSSHLNFHLQCTDLSDSSRTLRFTTLSGPKSASEPLSRTVSVRFRKRHLWWPPAGVSKLPKTVCLSLLESFFWTGTGFRMFLSQRLQCNLEPRDLGLHWVRLWRLLLGRVNLRNG